MRRFLLDTGVLLGFIRKAEWAERVWEEFNLNSKEAIIFTSIICVGELLALSEKLGWGKDKKSRLEKVLAKYSALDINDQGVLQAYAMIDAWTHGKKVNAPRQTLHPSQLFQCSKMIFGSRPQPMKAMQPYYRQTRTSNI